MSDRAQDQVASLPLFPLANVVLFPYVRLPLYIFEPRYRQMTKAALEGGRHIGMVTVVPDQIEQIGGDPGVFPIGCAGRIQRCKQRSDGTYELMLEGIFRFRIDRELDRDDGRLYRSADVSVLEDPDLDLDPAPNRRNPAAEAIEQQRAEVHRRYATLLEREAPEFLDHFKSGKLEPIPDSVYVNTISMALDIDPLEKQSLLECPSTRARFERLLVVLEFKLANTLVSSPPGESPLQ